MANTIASVLRRSGGQAPGVPQVRAVLVIAWIAFQSVRLTDGSGGANLSIWWVVPHAVIPALFAVLGFCLAKAAAERPVRDFLLDRARHAGPALFVAVVAAALVLGPLVSTSGLSTYLTDPYFALYFLNLAGWPQFDLPGVFEFNDYVAVVNEALWLTPCFAISAIFAAGTMRSRLPRRIGLIGTAATLALYAGLVAADLIPSPAGSVIRYSFVGSALAAIFASQCGVLCFVWRDRLAIGWLMRIAPLVVLGGLALVGRPELIDLPGAPLVIATVAGAGGIAWLVRSLPGSTIARRTAPVLHGAMLFSFPLQQLAIDRGPTNQGAIANLAFSLPAALVLAWAVDRITIRVGLSRVRFANVPEAAIALPDSRRPRSWRRLARQFAEVSGLAVVIAMAGVIVILLTVVALQDDPIGV